MQLGEVVHAALVAIPFRDKSVKGAMSKTRSLQPPLRIITPIRKKLEVMGKEKGDDH